MKNIVSYLKLSKPNTTFLYGKCPKISNTFLVLFSSKMLVIKAGIHKMLVRIANREDPDQTIWVCTLCLGLFARQLV